MEARKKAFRQDQIADAQARQHGPGKGSDIDNALSIAETVQGWNRMMEIAEFPIVIIFEEIDPFKLRCDNEVAPFLF